MQNGGKTIKEDIKFIESGIQLSDEESSQLGNLLAEYHDIFSLTGNERGETDLVEFKINTGDAPLLRNKWLGEFHSQLDKK